VDWSQWVPVCALALLLGYFLAAGAWMASGWFDNPELEAWAKNEFWEVSYSALLLANIVFVLGFAVTLSGVFYGMHFALPQMVRQGGGTIVNTASISGLGGDYRMCAYNAAKGGVVNLTRSAAIEYARKNIRINAVCPGMIETPPVLNALDHARNPERAHKNAVEAHPMGRLGKPEEIAKVVLFLACDDSSLMTGSMVVADGGVIAHTGLPGHPIL
jgi:NAD(P)-dependent dehydrogenase (short-subunit alcohol dehydrogenase family)